MFDTTTPMSTAVLHKLDKKWTPEGFFKGLKMEEKILYGHASLYYTDIIGDHTMFPTKSTTTTKYIRSDYYPATDLKPFALNLLHFFVALFSVHNVRNSEALE